MMDKNFGGCHWVIFDHYTVTRDRETRSKYEYDASHVNISVDREDNDVGDIRYMAFDIEACKFDGPGFVDAQRDQITQISCSVITSRDNVIDDVVFCLVRPGESVTPNPDIRYETFRSEKMLNGLKRIAYGKISKRSMLGGL